MPHVTPLHADDPTRVGRYRLSGRIAGMPATDAVYLGSSLDGSAVTITLLDGDWASDAAERDRFTAEAKAASLVAPFCAARILGSGFDGGRAYLASEYIAGPSLAELVTRKGAWRDGDLEALAVGTATGLAAIHQAGLVHGDFGPDYVVLGAEGPRVIEFGITPPYGLATPAADMRAWAQTVLYAAAGRRAKPADLELLPEPLRTAAAQCISGQPGDQPSARSVVLRLFGDSEPDAGVLGEGAARAARAAVLPPAPAPGPGAVTRPRSRRPVSIWLAAGIAACIVAAAVAIRVAQDQSGKPASAVQSMRPATTGTGQPGRPPAPVATVPAAVAGTWSGQVTQSDPAGAFSVRLSLASGATRGTVRYSGPSFACSGDLSVVSAGQAAVRLDQTITRGATTCANGVVTLSAAGTDALRFSFKGKTGPAAVGVLGKP